jgi:PKD repeat protein
MARMWRLVSLGVVLALVLTLGVVALPVGAGAVINGDGLGTVDFSASPTEGKAPLTVQFTDLTVPLEGICIDCWSWDFGDGGTSSEQNPVHTYNCAGEYNVSLTVAFWFCAESGFVGKFANGDGLEVTETKYGYITVSPVANFTAAPTRGQAPLTVHFSDMSTGCPSSWFWGFGDGGTSSEQNPDHTYMTAGSYTVSLTVSGSPSSTKTITFLIIVEEMSTPANLMVRDLIVTPVYAQPGQGVYVSAKVANEGGSWGSQTMHLLINGYSEQSVGVGVSPGTAQPISFMVYKVDAGEYQVTIGDATGVFYVTAPQWGAAPTVPEASGKSGGVDTGSMIAFIVIGVVLVGGLIFAFLFTRRA